MQRESIAFGDEKVPQRLWAKVEIQADGCWTWTGSRYGYKRRYGKAWYESKTWKASRLFYALLVRSLEPTEHAHHHCRNEACVNPAHIEPLPQEQHWGHGHADKTHCPQGHEYTEKNTYIYWRRLKSGRMGPNRSCRTCSREYFQRKRRAA
jgi:hypothetical protein